MKIQKNLWVVASAELSGNFMALNVCIREERSKISDVRFHLKSKVSHSRTCNIINIVEMNVIRNRQAIKKISKPQSCFLVKNNNNKKPDKLCQTAREKTENTNYQYREWKSN